MNQPWRWTLPQRRNLTTRGIKASERVAGIANTCTWNSAFSALFIVKSEWKLLDKAFPLGYQHLGFRDLNGYYLTLIGGRLFSQLELMLILSYLLTGQFVLPPYLPVSSTSSHTLQTSTDRWISSNYVKLASGCHQTGKTFINLMVILLVCWCWLPFFLFFFCFFFDRTVFAATISSSIYSSSSNFICV